MEFFNMIRKKLLILPITFFFSLALFLPGFAQKKLNTIIVDAGHGGEDAGAIGNYENSLHSREKDITLAISMKLVAELKRQLPGVKVVPTRTTDIYQNVHEKARIANENKGDLFICIHADATTLKNGRRQIGTRTVTRYKVSYTGKGKRKKKITTPYEVEEPVYEYFKIPTARSGTSVWIFASHKTDEKLKAIENELQITTDEGDSTISRFDFNTPQGQMLTRIYATRYQLRSDRLATLVNDEVAKTGRNSLGVSQRQKGIWVLQATNMPAILVETGFITNPDDERYLNDPKGQQEIAEAITDAVIRYKQIVESGNTDKPIKTVEEPKKPEPAPITSVTHINDPKVLTQLMLARKQVEQGNVKVNDASIKIKLSDNGRIDNDTVAVFYNGRLLAKHQRISSTPVEFNVPLDKTAAKHEVTIFAENLGSTPPNTAYVTVQAGNKKYEMSTSANMKENAVLVFELKNN